MPGKLNLIFDIDDTLLRYTKNAEWDAMAPETRAKFQVWKAKNGVFVLRPHFDEMMKFAFENCATVNLWTWSEREYGDGVAKFIQGCNPAWKIANVWVDDNVEASIEYGVKHYKEKKGHAKDLNYIWYDQKKFNPCDTILVDDRDGNVQNPSNRRNAIHIKMFHPDEPGAENDDAFLKIIEKLKEIMASPDFCKEGDLPFPLPAPFRAGRRRTKKAKKSRRRRKTSRA